MCSSPCGNSFPGLFSLFGNVGQLYPQTPRRPLHSPLMETLNQPIFRLSLERKKVFSSISGNVLLLAFFSLLGGKVVKSNGCGQCLLVHPKVRKEAGTAMGLAGLRGRWQNPRPWVLGRCRGEAPSAAPERLRAVSEASSCSRSRRREVCPEQFILIWRHSFFSVIL